MEPIKPLVSIIVPIYMVENYLQQCIDSIRVQTYSRLEIILVDDGSTDGCSLICDNNAEQDARIIVLHKENGGLSSARNAGLDIASGDYVSFIDADDTIHPEFIGTLMGLCMEYKCDIAQCNFLTVPEHYVRAPLNPLQSVLLLNNRQALYKLCCSKDAARYGIVWNKVYKKELFRKLRYPEGRLHEDEFIIHLLFWNAKKTAVINQYMYYYLQRNTSIMGRKFTVRRLDALDAYEQRAQFLEGEHLWEEAEATLRSLLYWIETFHRMLMENVSDFEDICIHLCERKETCQKHLDELRRSETHIRDKLIHSGQAKIVIYGAGYWGKKVYKWMKEKKCGVIAGWVDNAWNWIEGTDYPVTSIDSLMNIQFDYILIAIDDRLVQEEVIENLGSWGISRRKIILCQLSGREAEWNL